MTHTYSLSTEIGKVRLLIGDTDIVPITDAQFSDEELQVFLDLGGSVFMGAAKALEAWAATLTSAGELKSETIGDYSYKKATADDLLKSAARYAKQDSEIPYFSFVEPDYAAIGDPEV